MFHCTKNQTKAPQLILFLCLNNMISEDSNSPTCLFIHRPDTRLLSSRPKVSVDSSRSNELNNLGVNLTAGEQSKQAFSPRAQHLGDAARPSGEDEIIINKHNNVPPHAPSFVQITYSCAFCATICYSLQPALITGLYFIIYDVMRSQTHIYIRASGPSQRFGE